MAKTIINLSDPVSTLVTKTNTISSHLGDLSQLNVGGANDSDLVQAINFVNVAAQKTDSADIIALIDSSYIQAREGATSASTIRAFFQKDSANGIGYDSSAGRFFIPSNTINTAMLEGSIPDTKLASITTAGKVSLGALDIDGATDIGDNLADADLFIIDKGAAGVERKAASTRISQYVFGKVSGDATVSSSGALTIASTAVEGSMIAADAIDGTKIADDAINSEHYTDQSIDTAHIADGQVTGAKIADDTVEEANMADDAIGSAQLKSVSTLLIKNSSGSTLKTIHGAGA